MGERERIQQFSKKLLDPKSDCYIDGLLDVVTTLVEDCNHPAIIKRNKEIDGFLKRFAPVAETIHKQRLNYSDFTMVKIIGQGAFGQVQLVRHRLSNKLLAMKILNKTRMLNQTNSAFFWEERDIMAKTTSDWIVKLFYAFMDSSNLYFCMEYLPGGNLTRFLENDEILEEQAAFYIAEVSLSIATLHAMGFIHRDIKPENLLLDSHGHIKLADFGTCILVDADGYVSVGAAIGTPDYVSPEVLFCQEKTGRIGRQVDWWALGIMLYEMLFGETAFYGESLVHTYGRIMNYKNSLAIPEDIKHTPEAEDIIRKLLSDPDTRLGKNGIDDLKKHPFLKRESWNWDNIRHCVPPCVPELASDTDTSNFDEPDEDEEPHHKPEKRERPTYFNGENLTFAGFTFNRDMPSLVMSGLPVSSPVSNGDTSGLTKELEVMTLANEEAKIRIAELEKRKALADLEVKDLAKKIEGMGTEKKKAADQLKQLKQNLSEERIKREQLSSDYDRQLEEIKKSKKIQHQLEDQLDDERRSLNSFKAKLTEKEEAITALEQDVEQSTRRLREATTSKCELEQELLELMERIEEERENSKDVRDHQNELEKRNRELDNEVGHLTTVNIQSQRELTLLQESKVALEAKISELTDEVSQLKLTRSVSVEEKGAARITEETNSRLEVEARLTSVQNELQTVKNQKQALETQIITLESQMTFKAKDSEFLQTEIQSHKERLQAKDVKLAELTATVQAQKQDLNKHRSEYTAMESQREQMTQQLGQLKISMKKKEDELSDLKDRLEASQLFAESYKNQVADLEEMNVHLKQKEDALTKKYQSARTELDSTSSSLKNIMTVLDDEKMSRIRAEDSLTEVKKAKALLEVDMKNVQQNQESLAQARDTIQNKLRETERQQTTLVQELKSKDELTHTQQLEVQRLKEQNLKLQKEVDVEKKKVVAAVSKLQEVIGSGGIKAPGTSNKKGVNPQAAQMASYNDFKQLERTLKNKEDGFRKKEREYNDKIISLKKEMSDYGSSLAEESEKRNKAEKKLAKAKEEIDELYKRIDSLSTSSSSSGLGSSIDSSLIRTASLLPDNIYKKIKEGVIDIYEKGRGRTKVLWMPRYMVLKPFCIQLFNSKEDRDAGISSVWEVGVSQVFHVREVTHADLMHAKEEDLPRTFQIIYEGTSLSASMTPSKSKDQLDGATQNVDGPDGSFQGLIYWQGHSFQTIRFHFNTICQACNRACSDLITPPRALECSQCHMKVHHEHVEEHLKFNQCPGRVKIQLIRADSPADVKAWMARIFELKSIQKRSMEEQSEADAVKSLTSKPSNSSLGLSGTSWNSSQRSSSFNN